MPDHRITKVARHLMKIAADTFSNHGCNDLDLAALLPSVEDRRALMLRVAQWNEGRTDPVDYDPEDEFEIVRDDELMRWLADEGLEDRPEPRRRSG